MPDGLSNIAATAQQVELSIGRLESLSTLPAIAAQFLPKLTKREFSPIVLIDLIDSDPILALKMYSLAAQQGLSEAGGKFSLRRTVERLNSDMVRNAILSVPVLPVTPAGDSEPDRIKRRQGLLLHSLAVACYAGAMAKILPHPLDPEITYYAGLLHDIGKYALEETMPKSFTRISEQARAEQKSFGSVEQEHLGTDHTLLGKRLAQSRQLGPEIIAAIWLHHSQTRAFIEEMPEAQTAQVVRLADSIARRHDIGQSFSYDPTDSADVLGKNLGLSPAQIEKIAQTGAEQVQLKTQRLGLGSQTAQAEYCGAIHQAVATFAEQSSVLSTENRQLQIASSHLSFITDYLQAVDSTAGTIKAAEDFAKRWQKFYQTGKVCLYLPSPRTPNILQAVIVESLSQSKTLCLKAPEREPIIPAAITGKFAILPVQDHLHWLFDQLDEPFDLHQSRVLPLACGSRTIGAIVFEVHYPGDMELFTDQFRRSASTAGAVLSAALARDIQERLAEQLMRVLSQPDSRLPEPIQDNAWLDALIEMAAGAAHELNNPLAVISGRAQLLAEAESDREKKEILRQIYNNAAQASGVIDDLMSFAEPHTPRKSATEISQIIDEAVQLAGRKLNNPNISTEIAISKGVGPVFADSAQIVSAIANILANAVESYGSQGGSVWIRADQPSRFVKIQIRDAGCGMDSSTIHKAAQPFFSAKPAGRKRGMGLAYALRFIQINQGMLHIDSEPGQGTTVSIQLPCEQDTQLKRSFSL